MKEMQRQGSVVFLACLPALFYSAHPYLGVFAGMMIAACWWLSAGFFKLSRRLFPERMFRFAVILAYAALAQASWYLTGVKPLWILGVAVLGSYGMGHVGIMSYRDVFYFGVKFLAVFLLVVVLQGWVPGYLGLTALKLPAFPFFFLAALALFFRSLRPEEN